MSERLTQGQNVEQLTPAEQLMREFVQTPLTLEGVSPWKPKWQQLVKARLVGEHPSKYLHALTIAAHGLAKEENHEQGKDPEKELFLTALLLYEFEHRDDMPQKAKSYNKTAFTRLLLTHQTDKNQFGETAKHCIDQLSLQELREAIFNLPKGIQYTAEERIVVGEIAITRLEKEPEEATVILQKITEGFVREFNSRLGSTPNQNRELEKLRLIFRYSPDFTHYILQQLAVENPNVLDNLFHLYKKYRHKDPKTTTGDWRERETIENANKSSILQQAYDAYDEERGRREMEKQKQAELAQQEEEKQQKLLRQSRFAQGYIKTLPGVEGCSFRLPLEGRFPEYSLAFSSMMNDDLVMKHKDSKMLRSPTGHLYSFAELDEEITLLASSNSLVPEEMKQELQTIFEKHRDRLLQESEQAYLTNALPFACEALKRETTYTENSSYDDIKSFNTRFESLYSTIGQQVRFLDQQDTLSHAHAIRTIFQTLQEIQPAISDIYKKAEQKFLEESEKQRQETEKQERAEEEETKKEMQKVKREEQRQKKKERKEKIKTTKTEYLLGEIEHKMEYLKNLYELHTGLNLHDVDVEALDEDGTTIGSVSVTTGQGMSLKLDLKQRLTMQQKLEFSRDYVRLEMGENIDEIMRRYAMVDWVTPHEVGHLVDWASDHPTSALWEDTPLQRQTEELVATLDPRTQLLVMEMIKLSTKESFIDGIGFYCASTYGTSTIAHDQDEMKKREDIATAFATTMEIVKDIITKEAKNKETKSRYQFILLRFIAAASHIGSDTQTIEPLETHFQKLNQETNLLSDNQKQSIVTLFSESFEGGQQFLAAR